MKNNGRRIFIQQFHHVSDFDQLLEMRDMIESIRRSTGDSTEKVQSGIAIGLSPPGELAYLYGRLSELVDQTNAWVVREANGLYRIERRVIQCIISGGQTGVDRAALDWAIANSVSHGGWCPRGRKAEDGVIDMKYQLIETDSDDYEKRTRLNVNESDGTLILNLCEMTDGTLKTFKYANNVKKPCFVVQMEEVAISTELMAWLEAYKIKRLNVAGPRESKSPGIYDRSIEWLNANFRKF